MSGAQSQRFARPQLPRTRPERTAVHYFRGAAEDGSAIGGIPLKSTEAAMVAVVRMAYKVAGLQIDRSARLARRLREEGDRAVGPRSDLQALDATERLVFRGMMGLLGWLEGVASDRGNPVKRLAEAQYRILGAVLGLTPSEAPRSAVGRSPDGPTRPAEPPSSGRTDRREEPARFPVRVKHRGSERRAVLVHGWEYAGETAAREIPVTFYSVKHGSSRPLDGTVIIHGRRSVTLTLTTSQAAPAGLWRAALCDGSGMQVGHIEIML
jgi:hypothetical protein